MIRSIASKVGSHCHSPPSPLIGELAKPILPSLLWPPGSSAHRLPSCLALAKLSSRRQGGKQRCWQLCYREEIKFSFVLLHVKSGATTVREVPLSKTALLSKDFKVYFTFTVGPVLSLCLLKGRAHLGVSLCKTGGGGESSQCVLLLIIILKISY